jgi:hypothetical protein
MDREKCSEVSHWRHHMRLHCDARLDLLYLARDLRPWGTPHEATRVHNPSRAMSISRSPTTDGLPKVQAGMVRGLAVTSHQRSPYVPILSRAW